MRTLRHSLVVTINCLDPQGSHEAEARLIEWIETYGHTACSFGFDFFTVGRIAAKAMKGRIKNEA